MSQYSAETNEIVIIYVEKVDFVLKEREGEQFIRTGYYMSVSISLEIFLGMSISMRNVVRG